MLYKSRNFRLLVLARARNTQLSKMGVTSVGIGSLGVRSIPMIRPQTAFPQRTISMTPWPLSVSHLPRIVGGGISRCEQEGDAQCKPAKSHCQFAEGFAARIDGQFKLVCHGTPPEALCRRAFQRG